MYKTPQEVKDFLTSQKKDRYKNEKSLSPTHYLSAFYSVLKNDGIDKDDIGAQVFREDYGRINKICKNLLQALEQANYESPIEEALNFMFAVYQYHVMMGKNWGLFSFQNCWKPYLNGKLKVEIEPNQKQSVYCYTDKGTPIYSSDQLNTLFKNKLITFDETSKTWIEVQPLQMNPT